MSSIRNIMCQHTLTSILVIVYDTFLAVLFRKCVSDVQPESSKSFERNWLKIQTNNEYVNKRIIESAASNRDPKISSKFIFSW